MQRQITAAMSFVVMTTAAQAQVQCQPPAIVAGDTNVGLGVKYRAKLETGVVNANGSLSPSEPAAEVPQHDYRLDLGYDRQDRLIARKTVTTPAPDGESLALGSYRNIRSLHTIGNQLVADDNGCQYLGASPDNQETRNPIDGLATSGSITQGLMVRSVTQLQQLGRVTQLASDRMRVATKVDRGGPAGNLDADLTREYRLIAGNWVLSTAEISTVSTINVGNRTEYFKHTSTHDFAVLAQAINAGNEQRRSSAPLNSRTQAAGGLARRSSLALALPPNLVSPPIVRAPGSQPGQNLVLQHGIFASAKSWERMDGWLQPRYQTGGTLIPSLVSTAPLATQRDSLIAQLGLTGARDNLLIGHSNGGLIARSLAQNRPDLVRGVITNSTLHNGAILARALRSEAGRGISTIASHVGAGCQSPLGGFTCFLSYVLQDPFVSLGIANAAFDAAIPVTRDMQPQSAFIQQLNAASENFPRVSIENKADSRWIPFRVVGDALCNPDAGCGGRAWVSYVNASYIALRTCVPVALTLGAFDPFNARYYAQVAAYCSHVAGALDSVDRYWNNLYSDGEGGDGIVNISGQRWNGATAVRIANADSHTGVNKSDKVRDKLFGILEQQFQVPRRIDPANAATAVSAATYTGDALAPDSIIAIFGAQLADDTAQAASVPLPTTLAGATIEIKDAAGVVRPAGLFYASPSQINASLPAGVANGFASFTVRTASGVVRQGAINVGPVAPGLFTANSQGSGVASGYITRVRPGSQQTTEPLAEFDPGQQRLVARPIDLGPSTDQVYLVLFGTGIRNRTDLPKVVVQIGGVAHPVQYAGAQGMVGLDQINILLSRELVGRGEIDIRMAVDGVATNTVRAAVK